MAGGGASLSCPTPEPDDLKAGRGGSIFGVACYLPDRRSPLTQKIVAVAFLTRRDLDAVGSCLERVFPVQECGSFDEIVATLDALPTSDSTPEPNCD